MELEIGKTIMQAGRNAPQAALRQSAPPHAQEAAPLAAPRQAESQQPLMRLVGSENVVEQRTEGNGPGEIDGALRELNGYMQQVQRNLHFDVDDESGHTVVRVIDAETDEVIRQMPSEEVLALARHMKSMSEGGQGLFVMEKV